MQKIMRAANERVHSFISAIIEDKDNESSLSALKLFLAASVRDIINQLGHQSTHTQLRFIKAFM